MIDIYCKDYKCPICESKMFERINNYTVSKYCINDCYDFSTSTNYYKLKQSYFNVFDGFFSYSYQDDKEYINTTEDKIRDLIDYWKENDRYLAKILIEDKIE